MAGILWVGSKIVEPSKLSVKQFDDWYENDHALEVLTLPGVPSGTRYTHTTTTTNANPFLITYNLPSLSYTSSPAFQAVANQVLSQSLVDRIYANTSFDIRFYAEFALPAHAATAPAKQDGSAPWLACVQIEALPGREGDAGIWFAGKFALDVKALDCFVKARRFEFVEGVVRERNVVSVVRRPRWLALVEFSGEGGEVRRGLEEVLRTEVASVEVEWYRVRKVWAEGEVEKVGEGVLAP